MSVFSEHVWLEPCFWVVMVVNLHIIFHKVQKSLREFRVLGALWFFVDEIGRLSESFAELDTRSTKRLHLNQKFSAENVRVVIQPKETEALNLFGHYTLAPLQERKPGALRYSSYANRTCQAHGLPRLEDGITGSQIESSVSNPSSHPFRKPNFQKLGLQQSTQFSTFPSILTSYAPPSNSTAFHNLSKEQNCSHNISRGRTYLIYTIPSRSLLHNYETVGAILHTTLFLKVDQTRFIARPTTAMMHLRRYTYS